MAFFFIPLFLMIIHGCYVLIKKDNKEDFFFIEKNRLSKDILLKMMDDLEIFNKEDYSDVKERIKKYFADNFITSYEAERIEFHLVNSYFMGFKKRFIAFTKADTLLRIIYITTLIYSFIYFNLLIHAIADEKGLLNDYMVFWHIGLSIVLFIVPIVFWLTQLVLHSLMLSFFSGLSEENGKLERTQVIVDELIKLLKPGGRNTPVKLGRPTMRDWVGGGPI